MNGVNYMKGVGCADAVALAPTDPETPGAMGFRLLMDRRDIATRRITRPGVTG